MNDLDKIFYVVLGFGIANLLAWVVFVWVLIVTGRGYRDDLRR